MRFLGACFLVVEMLAHLCSATPLITTPMRFLGACFLAVEMLAQPHALIKSGIHLENLDLPSEIGPYHQASPLYTATPLKNTYEILGSMFFGSGNAHSLML